MPSRHRNPASWALDHPWYLVLLAGLIAFTVWAVGTRNQPHHVRAAFASAFNLVPGQAVSVDGLEVGKVGKVRYADGKALVDIGINDKQFWPLHKGTRVVSRWGTTIGSGTRRLDLVPGPATEPELGEDGIIPTGDTQAAVDVDQVLDTFTPPVRNRLRSWTGEMDAGLRGHSKRLNGALHTASGGVEATGDVMSDLTSDTFALRALIGNAHRVTGTLAARADGVRGLVTVASETFHTFAGNTRGTQASIDELPETLRQARTTLARVDSSVGKVDRLVVALAPGARRLTPLAHQARPALADLRATVPSAVGTVTRATQAAPRLSALMDAATPFMKTAPGVFDDLSPMIACLRPYAPELGGALVGGDGAHQVADIVDPKLNPQIVRYVGHVRPDGRVEQHGLRAMPMVSAASAEKPVDSEQFAKVSGKQYAYPRPPGLNANQPWFLPECGITKDALDPTKDPEKP